MDTGVKMVFNLPCALDKSSPRLPALEGLELGIKGINLIDFLSIKILGINQTTVAPPMSVNVLMVNQREGG